MSCLSPVRWGSTVVSIGNMDGGGSTLIGGGDDGMFDALTQQSGKHRERSDHVYYGTLYSTQYM